MTVLVSAGEAESYRKAGAARWFREDDGAESAADPFEPIPGHAPLLRIRKRRDGACGFLSPEGLCRIHEVLGAGRKPLTCRLFPFAFSPSDDDTVVTVSFSCPTVVANEGDTLASQKPELQALHVAWKRVPETAATIELLRGKADARAREAAVALSAARPSRADGCPDLRANLRRIAALPRPVAATRDRPRAGQLGRYSV
jgi:Fe-S-cluster containining protein